MDLESSTDEDRKIHIEAKVTDAVKKIIKSPASTSTLDTKKCHEDKKLKKNKIISSKLIHNKL